MKLDSQVLGGFLETPQTWANAGVYSAYCVHVLGSVFVCLFSLFVFCLFYRQLK